MYPLSGHEKDMAIMHGPWSIEAAVADWKLVGWLVSKRDGCLSCPGAIGCCDGWQGTFASAAAQIEFCTLSQKPRCTRLLNSISE